MTRRFRPAVLTACLLAAATGCLSPADAKPRVVSGWQVSRPLPSERIDRTVYPRFYAIFHAGWQETATADDGYVDLSALPRSGRDRIAFVRRAVASSTRRRVRIRVESSCPLRAFVNGLPAAIDDEGYFAADLQRGRNELFFMLTQTDTWRVRITAVDQLAAPRREAGIDTVWTTDAVFDTPESVLFDPARGCLYVSSFDNHNPGRDRPTGYISRLGLDGRIIAHRWVDQLRGPCGMTLCGDHLFVAEKGHLTEIDPDRGEVVRRHAVAGARFLNDVVAAPDGSIYISNTTPEQGDDVHSIYRFGGDVVQPWLGCAELSRVNGLWIRGDALLAGNTGDGCLKRIDLGTREVTSIACLGAGVVDGIRTMSTGDCLVSQWEGPIYRVASDGSVVQIGDLSGSRDNAADFEWIEAERLLIVPTFVGNRVTALRVR